ncbi:melatonin receptor type 1B-B-like [Mya arenaria]|uniref:melatonin receptor type 1B-B-like n=1 Tax=Mya arenaria TaxID=6604 RepID=UPI0022E7CA8E|nr:melatonin receptor type 1B-B-like [Mya arenaria]
MMNSPSLEFIDRIDGCMLELERLNLTNASLDELMELPVACNGSVYEEMVSYMAPLLETDFLLALIYCIVVSVALFVGTFGNLIILVVSITTRAMNRVGRDFVINLALADLCVAAVADPMCILGVVKGERWFQGRWLLCEVVASMCLTACFCAFLSLTLLTLNRYVYVCANGWYHRIYKRPICIALCACAWITGFLMEFPNFVGWGDHYFDKKNHQCIWDRTASFSYTLVVSAGFIGSPLVMMGACFIMIFYKIYKRKKDVFSLNLEDPLRMRKVWVESLRSSRTLLVVFLAFVVCWTPYAIVTAMDVNNSFSYELHLFITLLAHLHSSLNFIIYMACNSNFRKQVLRVCMCSMTSWRYRSSTDVSNSYITRTSSNDNTKKLPFTPYITAGSLSNGALKKMGIPADGLDRHMPTGKYATDHEYVDYGDNKEKCHAVHDEQPPFEKASNEKKNSEKSSDDKSSQDRY